MFKNLRLERPLAVLDLETTGTDPQKDRIVEISVLRVEADGQSRQWTQRVNPGIPIPPEATAVHHITNADVANEPPLEKVADEVLAILDGCDLAGFNIKRFDLRLLYVELGRVGRQLSLEGRSMVDAMEIFHTYEPRDLSAAVRFYCGREHESAHTATADVQATADILDAMLARYRDLPRSVPGIYQRFSVPGALDANGCFHKINGEVRFAFGKYRGQPLDVIARTKPDYLDWMLREAFLEDAKALVREALRKVQGPQRLNVVPATA
jgi:DNA polymerase-3 subunit epsilon